MNFLVYIIYLIFKLNSSSDVRKSWSNCISYIDH